MYYLGLQDYHDTLFGIIKDILYDDKKIVEYENNAAGLERLGSILLSIQNDNYYPDFYKKASYLFLGISMGHFFNNGNKRLALVSYAFFTIANDYHYKNIPPAKYKLWFKKYFPKYKLSQNYFETNHGWAIYNFNKIINIKKDEKDYGHQYNFDELKNVTEIFFKFISYKK